MAENRFKARQQKRAEDEENRLEQAKGVNTPVSSAKQTKQSNNTKMVPVQFYMSADDKKRLKMYCLVNDMNMTDLIKDVINDFLESKGV